MADITSPKWLYFKGILFVVLGLMASVLVVLENPTLRTAALLLIAVWSFSRAYYFAFYVIQHYIDPGYKFAGLIDFFKYVLNRPRKLG